MPKEGKKKKLGLILGLVIGLPLLLGVGAFGAIKAGVIKSPLVSKEPPKTDDAVAVKEPAATPAVEPESEPAPEPGDEPQQPAAKFVEDPDVGAQEIALIWSGIPPQRIAEMASAYKDPELARIVSKMDAKKAGAIIAALKPDRAAKVSREIEKQASMVPIEEELF